MLVRIYALLKSRNLEFIYDKAALGWNILLPVLLIAGFAIMFSAGEKPLFKVATINSNNSEHPFLSTPHIDFFITDNKEEAIQSVRLHKVDMLIDFDNKPVLFWINSLSQKGQFLEQLIISSSQEEFKKQTIDGKKVSYVDWVVPGIMGMNIMFSCLFGVGYVIVRYRKSGYLKRLNATGVTAYEFLLAQVISRLILIVFISCVLFIISYWLLDLRFAGSYFDIFVILLLGCLSIISLSLVIIARTSSEELASGLLNMLSWPMMFLSGVWFSLEGTGVWVQNLAKIFPLTHFLSASRAIIIDGVSLSNLYQEVILLSVITFVCFMIGVLSFKWHSG
jgi:ABC-2 type transport system permease protein